MSIRQTFVLSSSSCTSIRITAVPCTTRVFTILRSRRSNNDYWVAVALAAELTMHPTMPESMLGSHRPEAAARSGMWLGTSTCGFKGCRWQCEVLEFDDCQARDRADHPWDQHLQKHICEAHSHIIKNVYKVHFADEPSEDIMWDVYCEAVAVQERMKYPSVGSSVDRRAFAYTSSMYNDERIHAYICFVCAAIKVDTGRIRSKIKMMSGKWLFSVPSGALTKNLSFNNFKDKYAGHGSPLHVRGSGRHNDVSSPDFSDWVVHLSDDFPLSELCLDNSKAEADIAAEVQELRKQGLLCCPEDHTCKHGCHHHRRFCLGSTVPICTDCRLCLSHNMKSPVSLANDNWVGYVQDWVYEQEVTWMEKTVSSPHWTGLTVFTIGAKGQERNKTKRHLMHDQMFSAEVVFCIHF